MIDNVEVETLCCSNKGRFSGGCCNPPKTLKDLHTILTHRRTLFRHGCDSYALPGENSSRRHFEGFHLTTSEAHLPEIGVRGPFSY